MYRRILIPVHGRIHSAQALTAILELAHNHHSNVRFLHVMEAGPPGSLDDGVAQSRVDPVESEEAQFLTQALAAAEALGIPASAAICDTRRQGLGETVSEIATLWEADLIVVGSCHQNGNMSEGLGSGAEKILQRARVPVLVIQPQDDRPVQKHTSRFAAETLARYAF